MTQRLIPVYPGDEREGQPAADLDAATREVAVVSFAPTDRIETGQHHAIETTPARIVGGNPNRRVLSISNEGVVDIYIGNANVAVATGFRIGVGKVYTLECGGDIWAIVPSGTGVVHWLAELEAPL